MKKKLLLTFIRNFKPQDNENFHMITFSEEEDSIIRFTDKDPKSELFLEIEKYDSDALSYFVRSSGIYTNTTSIEAEWISEEKIIEYFNTWLTHLAEYNNTETIFDDPVIKGFEENYYSELEILNDESLHKPLKSNQILQIDEYLDTISEEIDQFVTVKNKGLISVIKKDIVELKDGLTENSKKVVLQKIANLWAKVTKAGIPLIKEFLVEVKKKTIIELVNQGAKILLE